jgi:hypothetical protein
MRSSTYSDRSVFGQMAVKPASRTSGRSVVSKGEATFSVDANRHIMDQRQRLAITNSLPVMENWTRVAQMAHFVANRCHTPIIASRTNGRSLFYSGDEPTDALLASFP